MPDAPKQPTESKAPKDLDARKKPKYQHESRKARAVREVREELRRYRMHRAREDLAASKAREHARNSANAKIGRHGRHAVRVKSALPARLPRHAQPGRHAC